jgi:hypothetical protein
MSMRIRNSFRKHRLSLLLLVLAYTAIFYGSSCECDCSGDPFWIRYGGEKGEIWVAESTPSTHPLELVVGKKGVTVSNVAWSITRAPSEGIIKPDGYEITPATGQQVSLKLSPQPSFKAAALHTISYYNSLFTKMGVQADFISSDEQGPQRVGREVIINAMQPSLHVYDSSGSAMVIKGNPVSGKRTVVDCGFDEPYDPVPMVLKVAVYFGSAGKPYQFFANVGSSKQQYLTINRIEIVDPEAANIHLTLYRGAPQPGNPSEFTFPLLMLAVGSNDIAAMDIVNICIMR